MKVKVGEIKNYFMRRKVKEVDFKEVSPKTKMTINEMMAYYKCAIMEVETKFKVLNEQFSLEYDRNPIDTIKSRLKSTHGIEEKLNRKGLPYNVDTIQENVKDVAGVRVICSFTEDIYMLAACLLQQDDVILLEKKDYFKNPKESGYRSLHLIVEVPIYLKNEKKYMKVEVQFRTIAMDFWATLEHKLRYKKDIDPEVAEELARELNECAEMSAELDLKMEAIKNNLYKTNRIGNE